MLYQPHNNWNSIILEILLYQPHNNCNSIILDILQYQHHNNENNTGPQNALLASQ